LRNTKKLLINVTVLIVTILIFLIISEAIFRAHVYYSQEDWKHPKTLEQRESIWRKDLNRVVSNVSKEHSGYRIIISGDSFTQGKSTDKGADMFYNSIPRKLQDILKNSNVEVLNFGQGGFNTLDEYFMLKDIGLEYNPDMIILEVISNDALPESFNLDVLDYCNITYSNGEKLERWLSYNWMLADLINTRMKNSNHYTWSLKDHQVKTIGYRCFEKSLGRIIDLCKRERVRLEVIFMTDHMKMEGADYFSDYFSNDSIRPYIETFNKYNLSPIYIDPDLMDIKMDDLYADDNYHYNTRANELIAKIVYNALLDHDTLPGTNGTKFNIRFEKQAFSTSKQILPAK
jgi:hypothetical protein